MSSFERAIAVFVHGFAFTRSFTHPYLVETLTDQVWALRDVPRSRGDHRTEEIVAFDISVADLDALAREKARGRFRVCYLLPVGDPDAPLRAAFKALGYRLMATESLMIHRQGIARSLLSRMLRDDCDAGATANVLLASHAGSKLYPTVGYETLGTLYLFTSPKSGTRAG